MMDVAEDRDSFRVKLEDLNISQPENGIAHTKEEARELAERIGYPVLVRPSFVLGGRDMEVLYDREELSEYLSGSMNHGQKGGLLIDRFLENSIELDVDAVCDDKDVLIGGIMEHVEHAGVHSGDSACVFPPQSTSPELLTKIERNVKEIAKSLSVVGLLNIQLAVKNGNIFLLEANPRSSRTVPFLSKAREYRLQKLPQK